MKFGFRVPSINKRIAARTSLKRIVRHNLGFKAPRGWGWITDPKKALYNRIYNKTSIGCLLQLFTIIFIPIVLLYYSLKFLLFYFT
jgi:hypothetical protein